MGAKGAASGPVVAPFTGGQEGERSADNFFLAISVTYLTFVCIPVDNIKALLKIVALRSGIAGLRGALKRPVLP